MTTVIPTDRLESAAGAEPLAGPSYLLVGVTGAVIGLAFLLVEQQWNISTYEMFQLPLEEAEAAVGSLERKLGYSLVFGLGLLLMALPSRRQMDRRSAAVWWAAAYVGWCVASTLWSDEPALTAKRVMILLMVVSGIVGVARQLTPREITLAAGLAAAFLVAAGLLVELRLGTSRPWVGAYRFAGTVHPNTQGAYCVVLTLSAWSAARGSRARQRGWWLVAFAGALLLILTKSRTCILGAGMAVAVVWILQMSSWRRVVTGAVCVSLIAAAALTGALGAWDDSQTWERAVMLGRQDESTLQSANGRFPLWSKSVAYAAQRPLVGYGYGAFWTAERMAEFSDQIDWHAVNAHSAYLDLWLGVGLVGLGMALAGIAAGLLRFVPRFARTPDVWQGFVLALLVFALINSFLESGFAMPSGFDAFLTGCGFLIVAGTERAPAILLNERPHEQAADASGAETPARERHAI